VKVFLNEEEVEPTMQKLIEEIQALT